MSKVLMLAGILIISLLLVISCGKGKKDMDEMTADESSSEMMDKEVAMPGADAAEIWTFITETSPYQVNDDSSRTPGPALGYRAL